MAKPENKTPNLDSVTTINEDGSHFTLHPADVKGRFTLARRWFAWTLLLVFFGLPWVEINGHQAVHFDVNKLRYHFFGFTISVQDLWVMFFVISGFGFSLFFITALLGRVWCGWTCPYTLLNEHLFRRIERWIEGDAPARRKLDQSPWTGEKIRKRGLKFAIYFVLAAAISHTFFSYFQSMRSMYRFALESPLEHWALFVMVWGLTAILLFCFSWFREQFCIVICPYGRLQSAMTDDDSMIVGYDKKRGEPRGKAKSEQVGDCVDCRRCVNVCPTGIDIRNGLQLECIGCAACIDACDDIMTKLKRPTGLIRYDSHNGIEGNKRRILRPRVFIYSILGLAGMSAFGIAFSVHARPFNMQMVRFGNDPYQLNDSSVRNNLSLRLVNKRQTPVNFRVKLTGAPAEASLVLPSETLAFGPEEERVVNFTIVVPAKAWKGDFNCKIDVFSEHDQITISRDWRFLGPARNHFTKKSHDSQSSKE